VCQHSTIWQGSGLAPGPAEDMHSSCTEAYGILAATQFLAYYVSCYNILFPVTTIKCYCDNSGDITTPCSMQTEQILCPNDSTNNDWDIFMEIQATAAKTTTLCYKYYHVKGHQDKDPQHKLSLAEQYDVNCNHYTKEYVQSSHLCSTTLSNPEFAAAQPHLIINGKVICCCFLPPSKQ